MSKLGSNINSGLGIELGSMTDATRNAGVSTAVGTIIYNSTATEVQIYHPTGWRNTLSNAISATGGTKTTSGLYTYHHFTTVGPAPFSVTIGGSMDIFVVGGGGGGAFGGGAGGIGGGGGGAGGIAYKTGETVAAASYTVVVGDGGAAGTNGVSGGNATNGGNSTFGPGTPIPYVGAGGGAGRCNGVAGANGGSGGGGGTGSGPTPGAGGSSTGNSVPSGGTTYGNSGGAGVAGFDPYAGGGGGGAAESGQPGGPPNVWPLADYGSGGDGIGPPTIPWLPTSYGESGYFAGGGGGGGWTDTGPSNTPGTIQGGNGGGGDGTHGIPAVAGTPGTANTGGGGGGGQGPPGQNAGNGGSGIVIIRYLT